MDSAKECDDTLIVDAQLWGHAVRSPVRIRNSVHHTASFAIVLWGTISVRREVVVSERLQAGFALTPPRLEARGNSRDWPHPTGPTISRFFLVLRTELTHALTLAGSTQDDSG